MISSLSSFIEVMFALYATIWIDKKFRLKIWKPDISPALNTFLERNKYWKEFSLESNIKNHIDCKMYEMHSQIYRLSVLMAFASILVLLYIGVGEDMSSRYSTLALQMMLFCMVLTLLESFVVINFGKYIIGFFICMLCEVAGLWIVHKLHMMNVMMNAIESHPIILRALISLIISFPFAYVYLMHWITRKKYFSYVEEKLNAELSLFMLANNIAAGKEENPQAKSKELPPEYLRTFAQLYAKKDEEEDVRYGELAKTFTSRFQKSCLSPRMFALLKVKQSETRVEIEEERYVDGDIPINAVKKRGDLETKIEKNVNEYIIMRGPKPKIKVFCKDKGIDFAAFMTEFRKKNH